MDMYSRRIEKIYKKGTEKKVRLINSLMVATGQEVGEIDIIYNRTVPDFFEELAPVLGQLTYLSDETKIRMLNLDVEKETELLEAQKTANAELFNINNTGITEEVPEEGE